MRPANADRDARTLESFDKLQVASNALQRYMELDRPEQRPTLDGFVKALASKDERKAEQWIEAVNKDRKTLEAKPNTSPNGKNWTAPQAGFPTSTAGSSMRCRAAPAAFHLAG